MRPFQARVKKDGRPLWRTDRPLFTGREMGNQSSDSEFAFDRKSPISQKGGLHNYLDICVNSERFLPEELLKPVKDGDELTIVPLLGGG